MFEKTNWRNREEKSQVPARNKSIIMNKKNQWTY